MDKKRLITAALPYVNNIPHLGNLIQVLSADSYARFCRSRGYETLYICGTDEYGTATETRATIEKVSPQELCDRYYHIHKDIYDWFEIAFDVFGRTSSPLQTEIVQDVFKKIRDAGYIEEREITQLYSEKSQMFLADRYVVGECPKCGYQSARGDQCENCGSLLDSLDLIHPKSVVDDTTPVVKNTSHLYINLPKLLPKLEEWVKEAKEKGTWSKNAIKMTESWIRDGLTERAITRDLKWGIPVPHEGFEHKVFYVWFDAPIGYISITATLVEDWQSWWHNPEGVDLYQFIGKDNIPFHTVVFPSSLLATGEKWTMLHHMSSTEYLNYEDGMFSKSKGVGVFGNDVIDTGIPVDMWRFYLFYNRPESSDFLFTWKDFQETVNSELINNLSNLCNRSVSFVSKYFEKKVLEIDLKEEDTKRIWAPVIELEQTITDLFEKVEIRQAYLKVFALSNYANKLLQDYEPWNLIKQDREKAHWVLSNLVYMVREIAIMIAPFTPNLSKRMFDQLSIASTDWQSLVFCKEYDTLSDITVVQAPSHLFARLEDKAMGAFKTRFSGSQEERESREVQEDGASAFAKKVCLKVSKIIDVSAHPDADKLYVLTLDDGSNDTRTIVSGIKDYYTIDELRGRNIVVVANLKPAKLRGVRSNGMLLAASAKVENREVIDVIFVDDMMAGTIVRLEDTEVPQEYNTLKIDGFFETEIRTNQQGQAEVEGRTLFVEDTVGNKVIITSSLKNAPVG